MPLNPAPIQEPIASKDGVISPIWVKWFAQVMSLVNMVASTITLIVTAAPSAAPGTAIIWTASGSGTKDGKAYDVGDVLITSNVGGVSKTALIADWSAL